MIYLVDPNVLLRFADRTHALQPVAGAAIRQLSQDGHRLQITAQSGVEFWNVVTRPVTSNGFGLTTAATAR